MNLPATSRGEVDTRVQLPARRTYSPEGGPGTDSSLKGSVCFITYERRLWPRASSLIKKETFGTRFGNRPLLGFAFRYNNGKM
jgi:hypothetical protein